MTFKSRIGVVYYIVLAVCIAIIAGLIVLAFNVGYAWAAWLVGGIAVIFALLLIFYLIPGLKDTVYELKDDHLLIKSGRHKLQIPYSSIVSVSRGVKSIAQAPAVSFVRLEIKYKLQTGAIGTAHISPVNESDFVNLLESKTEREDGVG